MRTFIVKAVASKHITQSEANNLINDEAEEFAIHEGITQYDAHTMRIDPYPDKPELIVVTASFRTNEHPVSG